MTNEEREQAEYEELREQDSQAREAQRTPPIVDANTGAPVRIHVVSWINNTVWRVAVAIALFAALYSIYDNGRRVQRLEGQVCQSLVSSERNIQSGTTSYWREHPDEARDQLARITVEKQRFHCPADQITPTIPLD